MADKEKGKQLKKKETGKRRSKPFPIVAIGASAGGLEAVTELLKNLPPDTGMAYVYIQHLDPTHKSILSDILAKATKMKVMEARNLLAIKPDHFYILPPNKEMVIIDGVLKLNSRPAKPTISMPINQFFTSVAEKQKEGSIGIVLSGNASDGTMGLKAIKIAGGLTFAQDDTAKFPGMPKSAIAEDAVDLVLPPAGIAAELARLSRHTDLLRSAVYDAEIVASAKKDEDINDDDLTNILYLLKKSTGVDFVHYKKSTIRRRVVRRMLLYKKESLNEYAKYLKQHTSEISTLYQDLLINVTGFFRDAASTDYIKKHILPRILKTKSANDPLRIWVPACSTGEEAYSLAIIIMELLGDKMANTSVQIFATDLSEPAITKARVGIYNKNDVAHMSAKRLQRFFTRADGSYCILKSIRDLCVFASHNVVKDPPFSRLDIISCCNLMIYLDTALQKKILSTFHYSLQNNGFLILGKSETIATAQNLFTQVNKKVKIYARKKDAESKAIFDMSYRIPDLDRQQRPAAEKPQVKEPVKSYASELEKSVDNILLERYVPACVVVNQDLEILQFRGSTGLFLEPLPGKASLNLLKMAKPGLGFELRNVIHKVQKSGEPFKKSGLEIKVKNNTHRVSVEVLPLKDDSEERHFLILFDELPAMSGSSYPSTSRDRRIKQLEQELIGAREDMRSIVEAQEAVNEELQSANEEIVSSNEELQSINEELETSKEEVESSNEELLTINQEIQLRNDQLAEAQEYSDAIFSTIREAIVVLDVRLRVVSANKSFYRIFNIREKEVEGRLIYEINEHQWDVPRLRELLEDIIPHNSQFSGFEISHNFKGVGEKSLVLNARKVAQISNKPELILLAIEDITEHQRAAKVIAGREIWLRNIANNIPVMIWVTDADKKLTFVNNAWLQYSGRALERETGEGWLENIYKDDRNGLLKNYEAAFNDRKNFSGEYRMRRRDGEYRWVLATGKPMYDPDSGFTGYMGTTIEIHEQRVTNEELEKRVKRRTQSLQEVNTNLERSNSELEQFAYVASHDLQEPLRKILLFSSRLSQHVRDEGVKSDNDYINKIEASAKRMSTLIDDLLNFSRVSQSDEKFVNVDLGETLKEVLKNFDEAITQRKVNVKVAKLPIVKGVPVQMTQLFHNLISNALKFASPQRPLQIQVLYRPASKQTVSRFPSLSSEGEYAEIIVRDNGIGFKNKFAKQIFIIFQRLHESNKYPGTGIGLALCKKIAAYNGGAIFAEAKDKAGAQFHVILPMGK